MKFYKELVNKIADLEVKMEFKFDSHLIQNTNRLHSWYSEECEIIAIWKKNSEYKPSIFKQVQPIKKSWLPCGWS